MSNRSPAKRATSSDSDLVAAETGAHYESDMTEVDTFEDMINNIMESRKMLANASYFASF
ncbi:MAG: hypothetical protein U5P10_07585 [Spirochaetia bacterium]|nr:hypothetical protein [Spirochaetia bacterium]